MGTTLVHIRRLGVGDWARYAEPIQRIERESFSPASRDCVERMQRIVQDPRAACYVALLRGVVAGYCLGAPLELFAHLAGVAEDPDLGGGSTMYCDSLAVSSAYRGRGVARRLKASQIVGARQLGYARIAGRNRSAVADAMWTLNQSLGATPIAVVSNAYDDGPEPRECIYYHIDLECAGNARAGRERDLVGAQGEARRDGARDLAVVERLPAGPLPGSG